MRFCAKCSSLLGRPPGLYWGGPGAPLFSKMSNLALRFKRKSPFWAQNTHRLGCFSTVKLKVTKKVNPSTRALIMPRVGGFTFSVTLSFTAEKQPTRCAFWGRIGEILLKGHSKWIFCANESPLWGRPPGLYCGARGRPFSR